MMKKVLVFLLLLVLFAGVNAQTSGTLSVSVTTSSTGGNYSPKNIVAVWVETESGDFVKTLLAYAATRKTHLNTWEASTTAAGSIYNTTDAITGATKTSHGTRTCTWDGTNISGTVVPDGNYKVWMELTDKNSTGNYSSFSFTKGSSSEQLTPSNVPSFSSISLEWIPTTTQITEIQSDDFTIFPNPTSGAFTVKGDHILSIEIRNVLGDVVQKTIGNTADIGHHPAGLYILSIETQGGKTVRKVFKE